MDKNMVLRYIENDGVRCLYCSSLNISADSEGRVHCEDCDGNWHDIMKLVGVGYRNEDGKYEECFPKREREGIDVNEVMRAINTLRIFETGPAYSAFDILCGAMKVAGYELSSGPFVLSEYVGVDPASEKGDKTVEFELPVTDEQETSECDVCHKPVLTSEAHWYHDDDCPQTLRKQDDVDCDCDNLAHPECCPACKKESEQRNVE